METSCGEGLETFNAFEAVVFISTASLPPGLPGLTDVIAAGCDAITSAAWGDDENISPSFLVRARTLIGNAQVKLIWGGGDTSTQALDGRDANRPSSYPRARYLSQQFVEELCSSKGASQGLLQEIERVIFEAHQEDQREGAMNFAELLDVISVWKTHPAQQAGISRVRFQAIKGPY